MRSSNTNMLTHTLKAWSFPATLPLCCQHYFAQDFSWSLRSCDDRSSSSWIHQHAKAKKQKKKGKPYRECLRLRTCTVTAHTGDCIRSTQCAIVWSVLVDCGAEANMKRRNGGQIVKLSHDLYHQHALFCLLELYVIVYWIAGVLLPCKST